MPGLLWTLPRPLPDADPEPLSDVAGKSDFEPGQWAEEKSVQRIGQSGVGKKATMMSRSEDAKSKEKENPQQQKSMQQIKVDMRRKVRLSSHYHLGFGCLFWGMCSSNCQGMCSGPCLSGTCLSMCLGTCLSTCLTDMCLTGTCLSTCLLSTCLPGACWGMRLG